MVGELVRVGSLAKEPAGRGVRVREELAVPVCVEEGVLVCVEVREAVCEDEGVLVCELVLVGVLVCVLV